MQRIAIAGATGYIGGRLAPRLLEALVFSWIRTLRSALGPHAFACLRKLYGAAMPAGQ